MNLLDDLKGILRKQLTDYGVKWSAGENAEQLLLKVLNFESKTITATPRTVRLSPEFQKARARLSAKQERALKEIIQKFSRGEDVNAHLSKASKNATKPDPLLTHWGIHHIHISNWKKNAGDYFYARTGPLIFAVVGSKDVCFLGIYRHGTRYPTAWTRRKLLQTINKNWPGLMDCAEAKGATDLSVHPTNQQLIPLRKSNINVATKVDGRIIMALGGGVMSDGTPLRHKMKAMKTIKGIKQLEKHVESNRSAIAERLGRSSASLDFELIPGQKRWEVREKNTGKIVTFLA
jgi:hypothetical protein